ncbi:MAG: restriction endonuclease [Chloroflexi bacterium]|nr:restriction endonuclease [Chloroflexota bacterium]
MALPSQSEFLRPILEIASNQSKELRYPDFRDELILMLKLSSADMQEKTPSGALRVEKHIRYCIYQLNKARLLTTEKRGCYQITPEGHQFLQYHKGALDQAQLNLLGTGVPPQSPDAMNMNDVSPDEQIEIIHEQLQIKLADELLESVKRTSPDRFEQLVIELLVKIGYGKGERVGGSGDGGIDGIITQDRLGFKKVYVQAKRWDSTQIGEPEIRNFSGSLDPHGASRGVFITTSLFSATARQTAAAAQLNNKNIKLIDGKELARLMIEYEVGVITKMVYKIGEIDENYFSDL